eukprot:gnl/MRDRNA2_/MRDRNA2_58000_c0_seq1.p1 gnl/MRDRNA2_/MRDRNA2_58000_c0~~gnl/MRDRNA2_/MRDRNA2_58000_c0_seq1.p1  ORF type:complete len:333 (+),score=65.48 gnl/MRDRNA2_/MRDRNA2_58000_c0_seq1:79-999(+)
MPARDRLVVLSAQLCAHSAGTSDSKDGLPTLEVVDHVAYITLNDPKRRNPLTVSVLQRLMDLQEKIAQDRIGIRAVVLQSTGPVFCSGHDFGDFAPNVPYEKQQETLALCSKVNMGFRKLPQPVVARVQGLATAGGCQLACSCDLVIASRRAAFRTPGTAGGGFCHTPGVALAQKIHPRKALEILLLAKTLSAEQAEQLGLVNIVAEPDDLEAETQKLAAKMARASAFNIQMGKQAFYEVLETPTLVGKYELAGQYMLDQFNSADALEATNAFLSSPRRKPDKNWKHTFTGGTPTDSSDIWGKRKP